MQPMIRNHTEKKGPFFGVAFFLSVLGVKEFWQWAAAPPGRGFIQLFNLAALGGGVPAPTICPCAPLLGMCVSVQFSRSVLFNSGWPHGLQLPGLPVCHQLPELAQTHVHRVSDAIQVSHPLLSPLPPALILTLINQGLFQWVSYPYKVARVSELQLQHQSFQWIFTANFL